MDILTNILIVDDEPRVLQTLARNLELAGYQVVAASGGEEALRLYQQAPPDVTLLDVRMPQMDGFAVLAAIRALDADAEVIQMTGHGDMETAIEALRAGASDFLPKQVDRKALEAALHRASERLRLKRELVQTREDLRASEADYRTITETAFVGVGIVDMQENLTFVNAAFADLLGYTREELLGMNLAQLAPPEEFEFFCEQTTRRKSRVRDQYETRLLARDGRILDVLVSAAPLYERGAQEFTHTLGVVANITERKQAERERDWEARVNAVMAELAQTMLIPNSLDAISELILERAKDLTGSRFGFVGFIDPHTGYFVSSTMTHDIWDDCQVPDKTFIFEHFQGLWGWMLTNRASLFTNDPPGDPRSTGVPGGHIAIERFLAAPALYGETLVGGIALANPPCDYAERDLYVVERMATLYALAVQQQRAQAQVYASEERFRQLVELAPDGLISVDSAGRITLVNAQAEKLFGYTRAELLGQPIELLLPERFVELHTQHCAGFMADSVARPMGIDLDLFARRKDGSEFPVDVSLGPVETENGLLVMSVVRDITERRFTEERLRLQSAALEAAANAIVITDRQGAIQWVNPAFTQLTGYTAEEALGQNPRVLKSGQHPRAFYRKLWHTILAGGVWQQEIINRRKDGVLYTEEMTIAPVRDTRGAITHFIAIKQDVTARKEAETELLRSREQYMLAVNGSNDGIWDWDLRAGTLFLSPKWKQMIGYAEAELPNIFETFAERLHPDDSARVLNHIEQYLKGEIRHYNTEFRFRHRDGSYRWMLARGEALRDAQGIPYRMAGSHTDITERKEYENALREARDELEVRVQERTAELSQLNARLEATLSALPDFLFELDLEGRIYDVRVSDVKNLFLPPEEFLGRTVSEVLPTAASSVIYGAVERAAQHRLDAGAIYALPAPDGLRWYELSVALKDDPTATLPRFIALVRDVTERVLAERALQISHQHQSALNALLRLSLEDAPLTTQLERALDEILALPWIPFMPQGAILLTSADDPAVLGLTVQRGLSAATQALCHLVPFDTCLCGRAARSQEIVFASDVDERHDLRPDGIVPHGHYCVPLLSGQVTLGVLTLYLQPGHKQQPAEEAFLQAAANTLSNLIVRKRADLALRASQRQYAGLVNSIEGVVWEADAMTDQTLFVSSQAEALLGYPAQLWLDQPNFWQQHIHAEDQGWVSARYAAAIAAREDYEIEYRMIAADGRIVWVRDMVAVSTDGNNAIKVRGIRVDVSARKDLEKRLNAIYQLGQELTLLHDAPVIVRRVLETAGQLIQADLVGCALVDEQTHRLQHYLFDKMLVVEQQAYLDLSLDSEQGIGVAVARCGQLINLPDTQADPRYIPPLTGKQYRSELCAPLKVGAQVLGVLNVESEKPHAFSAADEQLLQTLSDQAAVALANADLYTRLQYNARELAALNSAIHALAANLDLDEVLQQTLQEINGLLGAEDASVLLLTADSKELIFAAVAGTESAPTLLHYRIPADQGIAGWAVQHGQSVLVANTQEDPRFYKDVDTITGVTTRSLLAVPLVTPNGVIGVIEIINKTRGAFTSHDQELLEALSSSAAIAIENARLYQNVQNQYETLRQTQAQLIQSEKMSALGRLVASIAHEINNPLQSIQGCLTLAEEELEDERRRDKLENYLHVAEGEIDRIAAIVRRVREFYRPADQDWHITDIHAALESVLALTNKQLQHSDIVVVKHWEPGLPRIEANADYLKQVFLNLILNAIDAMPEGGTLKLRTGLAADMVRITFCDTGVGMSRETVDRLFEPFFTTKPHGSGLGLSISYGIIQSHKGHIAIDSEEGGGTTISILLPLAQT